MRTIDLDRELNFADRAYIREKYHETVKDWICDGIAYPLTFCVAFWCAVSIVDKLL
jgi:hypothetical protein